MLNLRRVGGVERAHIMIAVGRVPAHARARRCQHAQFRPHQFAGANEKHRTGLQIEKYRQESHAALASPTYGVDWNYFLYMSHHAAAKRKLFLLYCSATIEFSPLGPKAGRCIFSATIMPTTGCTAPFPSGRPRSRKFQPKATPRRPQWTTSTRSRPRASTSSGKLSRG